MEITKMLYCFTHSNPGLKIRYKATKEELISIADSIRDHKPYSEQWDADGLITTFFLNEKDLQSTLLEYEKDPEAHAENRDLWIVYLCCCVILWPELSEEWPFKDTEKDMEYMWRKSMAALYHVPEETVQKTMQEIFPTPDKPHYTLSKKDKALTVIGYATSTLSAEARFLVEKTSISAVVTCKNKHDALMYKLIQCVEYPEETKGQVTIKRCKCDGCNALFIVKRTGGNRQYCEKHSGASQAVNRSRRKAREKDDKCSLRTEETGPGDLPFKKD